MRTDTKKSREQSRRTSMYSEEGVRRSYSMHSKTHYDKIKEMLSGKSNEELLTIVRTLLDEAHQRGKHIHGLIPYIYGKDGEILNVSDTKLIELIAEISWKLGEDWRTFNPQKYMKNLFRGRQKGRAYKAFIER